MAIGNLNTLRLECVRVMQERAEALELYGAENRKRKLIHNKLLELQGTHTYMSIPMFRYGSLTR